MSDSTTSPATTTGQRREGSGAGEGWRYLRDVASDAALASTCGVHEEQQVHEDGRDSAEDGRDYAAKDERAEYMSYFQQPAANEGRTAREWIVRSFDFFDQDGDGIVSRKDLRKTMAALGEPITAYEAIDILGRGARIETPVGRDDWLEVFRFVLGAQYNHAGKRQPYLELFPECEGNQGETASVEAVGADIESGGGSSEMPVPSQPKVAQSARMRELFRSFEARFAAQVLKRNHNIPMKCSRGELRFICGVSFLFAACLVVCVVCGIVIPDTFGSWDGMVFAQCLILFLIEVVWESFLSWIVLRFNVKINYTRKFGHIIRLPKYFLSAYIPTFSVSACTLLTEFIFSQGLFMFIFSRWSRIHFQPSAFLFLSQDRREDRPYTFRFQITEDVLRWVIYFPFYVGLLKYLSDQAGRDLDALIFIPITINTIGDGLAEPVGVRFGKHKYRTKALYYNGKFWNGSFVRSLEGSACVFVTSVIIIAAEYSLFNTPQFIFCMCTIPLLMTVGEAYAPHTNDGPFLAIIGCGLLAIAFLCL